MSRGFLEEGEHGRKSFDIAQTQLPYGFRIQIEVEGRAGRWEAV